MKSARHACAVLLLLTAPACNLERTRPALGKANSIVVAAADSIWAAVGDSVIVALGPRIFTVRDERTFELTYVSPTTPQWRDLRQIRQILAIGTPDDPWIQPVLANGAAPAQLPAIVERQEVWARNQLVTAIVLPPGGGPPEVLAMLDSVGAQLDFRYREYARSRMFVSGVDSALQDTLARTAGFSLLLPDVYRYQRIDSSWVFRNHSEMSGTLQRAILVTWRAGVAPELGVALATAWRDSIGDVAYDPRQDVETARLETRALASGPGPGFEVQGIWQSEDPGWPAAGPFITRLIACPDQNRTYLLDAWLFAPGKAKYEYMIQLNTILDSFRCGAADRDRARSASL
jgi:hypothetical protein